MDKERLRGGEGAEGKGKALTLARALTWEGGSLARGGADSGAGGIASIGGGV